MSGHDSSPSERPPSSAPKQSSRSVEKTPRVPVWRRAIPSTSRSSSSGSMRTFESEPMQSGILRCSIRAAGRNPSARSASVVGQAQTVVPLSREQVELGTVRMRRVHDGDVGPEAAGALEELDRPAAVLREALLDLPGLLVGVDVQREAFGLREAPELLEPFARAGANGVGGEADAHAARHAATRAGADTRPVTPGASAAARRARTPRAGGRSRAPLRRQPPLPRAPRPGRGSGTRRRPCSRQNASPDTSRRRGRARSPASAARPPPASARARPRSRRRRRGHAARAGKCGCGR